MSKVNVRKKTIHHTLAERAELKRVKQRSGPCKMRRRERRKAKQEAYAEMHKTVGTPHLAPVYELLGELNVSLPTGHAYDSKEFVIGPVTSIKTIGGSDGHS